MVICIGLHVDLCADSCSTLYYVVHGHAIDVCLDMCKQLRVDICVDMSIDISLDVCMDVCVCDIVYRRV